MINRIVIRNISLTNKTYQATTLSPDNEMEFLLGSEQWRQYAYDTNLITDILNGEVAIGNGEKFYASIEEKMNHLYGHFPLEVTPRAPKNEHCLQPFGARKGYLVPQNQTAEITLSNKSESGLTFNYTCSKALRIGDYIFQANNTKRSWITAIDTENSLVTVESPNLENGVATYSIGYWCDELVRDWSSSMFLWGVLFSEENADRDDFIEFSIVDKDGLFELEPVIQMVFGSQYTLNEAPMLLEALGFEWSDEFNCWTKYYDESMVHNLRGKELKSPDGAPGQMIPGLYLRVAYYTTKTTITPTEFYVDYNITSRDY